MRTETAICYCAVMLLVQLTASSAAPLASSNSTHTPKRPLALDMTVSSPIYISTDGEFLLVFWPGLQGFELVNTRTGQRDIVSETPCTGYFASISPDKKYVSFKNFTLGGGQRLQVPTLYDIARKKLV